MFELREFISTHTASKAEGPLRARPRRGRGPTAGEAQKGPSLQWARGRSERLEKFWGETF